MNKINIIGLDSIKTDLIKKLMDLGVVEINSQDSKLTDPEWISYVKKDGNENEVFNLDVKISQVTEVLNTLEEYDTSKRPLFNTRKSISSDEFYSSLGESDNVSENVAKVLELNKSFNGLCAEANRMDAVILSLKPWVKYTLTLDMTKTKYTSIIMGVIPIVADIEKFKSQLFEKTDRCYMDIIDTDKDQYYCSFICLQDEEDDIYELLKQYGFSTVTFRDLTGTAAENIMYYEKILKDIYTKQEVVKNSIKDLVSLKEDIQVFHDYLVIERDKKRVLSSMLKTDTTFYIEGWIPENSKENLEKVLDEYECWYDIKQAEEDEEFPILLNNNSFIQPFETITELYSLPSSSNIDPTAFMAPFYAIFFGLMLADVGYGAIMSILCFLVLKKFKPESGMEKFMKLFLYCGISTAFWGVMFGSWFGDAIPAAAKLLFNSDFTIKALWLNPMEEPMTLLIFSFIFGVIHLFTGMAVNAYMLIRDGKTLDAVFDIGFWYGLIIGIALWLFGNSIIPGSNIVGQWMTIIFAIGLVLTQGRAKNNIINKLVSGVLSLYNITSYLSDILSYSRLLALGLATGVVSSVVSILGSMGGRSVLGILLFVIVMLIGHVFNFAINALGAFVHSARLQYVEFFGKFYEGGGESFNPLIKKTKYYKIIKEDI